MKRMMGFVAVMVLAMVAWTVRAADREQFSVNELSIGDPLVKITRTGTQLNEAGSGTRTMVGTYGTALIESGMSNGTTRVGMQFHPASSDNSLAWVLYNRLFNFGDIGTGSEWGFGSTNKKTYGVSMYFGRENSTGANWSNGETDSGLELSVVNKKANAAGYCMQGGHIKAYNYASGSVSNQTTLHLEADAAGTNTGDTVVLKVDGDAHTDYLIDMNPSATPVKAEIRFSNGLKLQVNTTNLVLISADDATTNYCALSAKP